MVWFDSECAHGRNVRFLALEQFVYRNPSCHLPDAGPTPTVVGKDETPDLEDEALKGGGVDALGEPLRQGRAHRLDRCGLGWR